VKLRNGANLLLSPEYGGEVFYFARGVAAPEKWHLKLVFTDGSTFTVRLTSMGGIHVFEDNELGVSYMYRRDFNPNVLSPAEDDFTFARLASLLTNNHRALKSVLVGKDAVLVGLSNSAFQDILYRAKLHPKRKAADLNANEQRALYDAIKQLVQERLRLKGKDQFRDLYGRQGGYTPVMGPNLSQQRCPTCGTPIRKLSLGGGQVFLCPKCQR
jgi:formamidopyrimidine-DNA glycosylase